MQKLVLAGLIVGAALASEPASAEKNVAGWTFTGAMTTPRYGHTATLLWNGKVLVAGGAGAKNCDGAIGAELYDPETGRWTTTTAPNTGGSPAVLVNAGGKVPAIAEGCPWDYAELSAQLFDKETQLERGVP